MNSELQEIRSLLDADEEAEVTPLESSQAQALRKLHPDIPDDYIELLSTVGWGNYGFAIYSAPVRPETIFGSDAARGLEHYLIFGDDMAGWMFAYDTRQTPWEIALLNHNQPPKDGNSHSDVTSFVLSELTRS